MKALYPRLQQIASGVKSRKVYIGYLVYFSAIIIGLRVSGVTQRFDWYFFDEMLRARQHEEIDPRITIVTIDDEDLANQADKSTISDLNLANALNVIAAAKPTVIGVDIIRDGKLHPGLKSFFSTHNNAIGLYTNFSSVPVSPPIGLPESQIGFGDYFTDSDGRTRRMVLTDSQDKSKYSFAFQVSQLFLNKCHLPIEINSERLILGNKTIYPLQALDGGYQGDDLKDFQILVNYRNSTNPFVRIRLRELLNLKNESIAQKFQGQIVLIGYRSPTFHDFVSTTALPDSSSKPDGNIYGVDYHAHVISQLISTALDGRKSIYPLQPILEYLWILGCVVWSVVPFLSKNHRNFIVWLLFPTALSIIPIIATSYLFWLSGYWITYSATLFIILIGTPVIILVRENENKIEELSQSIKNVKSEIHARITNPINRAC